jgi:hypothetical protein
VVVAIVSLGTEYNESCEQILTDYNDDREQRGVVSTLTVAALPWMFTQHHPLNTSTFIDEAKRRGVDLDISALRELYRYRILIPFFYVNNRAVSPVPLPVGPEPKHSSGTMMTWFRHARDKGRLSDLAEAPFRPRLRFYRTDADPHRWWNGLIYSWYQLLVLPELGKFLAHRRHRRWEKGFITILPQPDEFLMDRAGRLRRMAVVLATLEARYLPNLDPEWIHLVNAEAEEWGEYRSAFDPVATSAMLEYPAKQAREDAEWLLLRAHRFDPVGSDWGRLLRRAPRDSWKNLKDAALSAMDYREAAEILLRFYAELASRQGGEPLPDIPSMAWHPLHERLSYRPETLDQDLTHLGLSPHPRVVLAVEGEAEEVHTPLVWRTLGYPQAPELVRLLKLGGVNTKLQKVAALAVTPLVGGKIDVPGRECWRLIKPPTRLLVAVDPEGPFRNPQEVAKTKALIVDEIKEVLKAQGVNNANPSEIDLLVEIQTWPESCYEYAHFTNDELADGIMEVHRGVNGYSRNELVAALRHWRDQGKDIKRVWESGRWDERLSRPLGRWDHEVSKVELAKVLWPTLAGKVQACMVSAAAPVPPIAEVVQSAYHTAQRWRYQSYVLSVDRSASDVSSS